MTIIKTFIKNYSYGTFLGVLTYDSFAGDNHKKANLDYFELKPNGTTEKIEKCCKETLELEKQARNFINKQNYFVLWSY